MCTYKEGKKKDLKCCHKSNRFPSLFYDGKISIFNVSKKQIFYFLHSLPIYLLPYHE